MPFIRKDCVPLSSDFTSTDGQIFVYPTSDEKATIEVSGYFNELSQVSKKNDFIHVTAADGFFVFQITSNTGDVPVTAAIYSGGGGGGGGDVVGPSSSTDNGVARWDGTSGKLLKDSTNVFIADNGTLTANNVQAVQVRGEVVTGLQSLTAGENGSGGTLTIYAPDLDSGKTVYLTASGGNNTTAYIQSPNQNADVTFSYPVLPPGTTSATFAIDGGGGDGDVVGPSSATNNGVARWDSTTGKLLKDSSVTIADNGDITTSGGIAANNAILGEDGIPGSITIFPPSSSSGKVEHTINNSPANNITNIVYPSQNQNVTISFPTLPEGVTSATLSIESGVTSGPQIVNVSPYEFYISTVSGYPAAVYSYTGIDNEDLYLNITGESFYKLSCDIPVVTSPVSGEGAKVNSVNIIYKISGGSISFFDFTLTQSQYTSNSPAVRTPLTFGSITGITTSSTTDPQIAVAPVTDGTFLNLNEKINFCLIINIPAGAAFILYGVNFEFETNYSS